MATQIVSEEFPQVCRDCGCPMHGIAQSRLNGTTYMLYSCWNADCLLNAVTLTAEQHNRLTEAQLDEYRVVNRQRVERQYKPLFDAITARVSECSGYVFVGTANGLVCAEFRFPGGKFPLALDPCKPLPYLVDLVQRGLKVCQIVSRIPQVKPLGV